MCTYIYVCICMCIYTQTCIYIYIYIYIFVVGPIRMLTPQIIFCIKHVSKLTARRQENKGEITV